MKSHVFFLVRFWVGAFTRGMWFLQRWSREMVEVDQQSSSSPIQADYSIALLTFCQVRSQDDIHLEGF